MHAANTGATEAKTISIGLKASLLTKEKITDKIFTHEMDFHFFFARRFTMLLRSEALIFYPGGYGTLNELLENAMLMQNNIVDNVPLICVGKKYWQGLFDWLKQNTLEYDFINDADLKLLYIVDSVEEVLAIIKKHAEHK
ncbi:LOG family protein [Candidatus Woesearchaeota archaeon]|nr:LOG family protein [Candidatus Woesearchaeota archaeon]